MIEEADFVSISGRESMALDARIALLESDLLAPPFLGIGDSTRALTMAIHDLKLTIGWIRNTVALYRQRRAAGMTDEGLARGARTFVSPLECAVLAWRRGGYAEYQRVMKLQRERGPQ